MLIGVVSDTHAHLGFTLEATKVLEEQNVEMVLHCGDIGSPSIVPLFDRWPTHFVFGNVDHDEARLQEAIEVSQQTCHGRFGSLEIADRKIALLHSDDSSRFRETVTSGEWDLVCYGHTHVADEQYVGKTLVLNPGALYRANPRSLAVVDLTTMDVTRFEL